MFVLYLTILSIIRAHRSSANVPSRVTYLSQRWGHPLDHREDLVAEATSMRTAPLPDQEDLPRDHLVISATEASEEDGVHLDRRKASC